METNERLVVTPAEYAEAARVGKSSVYEAIGRGEIDHIRIGRSIRIPVKEFNKLKG